MNEFDTFYRETAPSLVMFLMKLGAGRQEAEDAAQEAMLRAYRAWLTIEYPHAWVRVVAWRIHVSSTARTKDTSDALTQSGE